jgi:hypothetical protein
MTRTSSLLCVLGLLASMAPAAAQVQVEKRRPAPAAGELSIDNDFGSVVVHAWDQQEVLVRGVLAAGAEGLDFDGDKEGVEIGVEVPSYWFHVTDSDAAFRSNLEVFAPVGSSVRVESVNADITVDGFKGEIDLRTVNGRIQLTGPARDVEIETMTGAVDVSVAGAPIDVTSISGPVILVGARGEVDVETVSAPVSATADILSSARIKTITGAVSLRGALTAKGRIDVETFSGTVTLTLPKNVKSHFELQSFSGEIRSALGPGTPDASERFSPYRRQIFATGLNESEVKVNTHDADIVVEVE